MSLTFNRLVGRARSLIWAIIVAYMLGIHNFYKGEDKTSDNIVITIELDGVQEDGEPKD
jgi:hypothetical protein